MKQAVLKIKRNTKVAAKSSFFRVRLLNGMFVSLGVLIAIYLFMVASITFNIVNRKISEAETKTLSAKVGQLELSYLSAYKDIDLSASRELGFIEVKPEFVTRSGGIGTTALSSGKKLVKNEI